MGTKEFSPILRFAVMSDCHYDEGILYVRERFRRALEIVYAYADGQGYQGLDALYVNGDFTNRGTRAQMELFRKDVMAYLRKNTRLVLTMANHDLHYVPDDRAPMRDFAEIFGQPYDIHTVIKGYHFISLSTEKTDANRWHDSFGEGKRRFLADTLREAYAENPKRPIFVFQHPGIPGHAAAAAGRNGGKQIGVGHGRVPGAVAAHAQSAQIDPGGIDSILADDTIDKFPQRFNFCHPEGIGRTLGHDQNAVCQILIVYNLGKAVEQHQVQILGLVAPFAGTMELEQQGRVSADIVRDVGNERKAKFFPGVLDDLHENHSFGYIIRQPEMFVNRG